MKVKLHGKEVITGCLARDQGETKGVAMSKAVLYYELLVVSSFALVCLHDSLGAVGFKHTHTPIERG